MRKTNVLEKLLPSVLNVLIVGLVSLPVFFISWSMLAKKLFFIGFFFVYNLFFIIFNKNRCLGMIIAGTYWEREYSLKNNLVFLIFYSLSFSTLFFWIIFPFDLFLFNMLFLQLPLVLIKGTTFHGYLSGNMATVKKE